MDPEVINAAVRASNTHDTIEQNCGPNKLMGVTIWEVWVSDKFDQMATRFVEVDDAGNITQVMQVFEKLVDRFNSEFGEIQFRREAAKRDYELKRITVIGTIACALSGFIATLGMFIYLTVHGGENSFWPSIVMAASVLVTCGTYLFEKFVMVDTSVLGALPGARS
ncbi:hypothetical protein [Bradyrhizobium sp. SEMIA]|uniref:hypothetical protein n=1 Tax=Bradyrhizobium sp. SEMIA TaxID=2597515 RepID=UPI0018A493F7|nr:hypothetical protein [Bradyrhizobium sp. SEMIA]QOG18992.1 hypothetical protein FOM02_18235 [Bradyrhizobium sp. SEMIA]